LSKSVLFEASNTVGNSDARQAGAKIECAILDDVDAVGDGEITASTWASNQLSAVLVEQQWSCRTVIWIPGSNHNTRQAAAPKECAIPNTSHAAGNGNARQVSAASECATPDAGDAAGNVDARQAAAAKECVRCDAGDAVGNGDAY